MSTTGEIEFLTRTSNTPALNSTSNNNLKMLISDTRILMYSDVIITTSKPQPTASALYLRQNNGFSSNSNPDVTWFNDISTGIFHPANNIIGFSISGQQIARMTSTGLIVGSSTNTSNRILINNTTSIGTYLQATNQNSLNGALFGVNSQGAASILSRGTSGNYRPIALGFANQNVTHRFDETTFSIYGFGNSVSGVPETTANTSSGTRVIRGYSHWTNTVSGGNNSFIGSVYLPWNCIFSMEVTYTTSINSGTHFKVQKQLLLGRVGTMGGIYFHTSNTSLPNPSLLPADGGSIPLSSSQNPSGVLGREIYKMSSDNGESNIGNGYIHCPGNDSIEFYVRIKQGLNVSVTSSASYVINIIDF